MALILAVGFLFCAGLELCLRAIDPPRHPVIKTPLIGSTELFTSVAGEVGWRETNPSLSSRNPNRRGDSFVPYCRFLQSKPKGELRILCLGDASTAGWPYSAEVSYAHILESELEKRFPRVKVQVINAGKRGASTSDLLRYLPELLSYDVDLLILLSGNNDTICALGILQTILDAKAVEAPMKAEDLSTYLDRLRKVDRLILLRKIESGLRRMRRPLEVMYWQALADGDALQVLVDWVNEAFVWSLNRIYDSVVAEGCRLMVVTVPIHLRWPPTGPSIPAAEERMETWIKTIVAGREALYKGDLEGATLRFRESLAKAPAYAPLHYDLARALEATGKTAAAKDHYLSARRYDITSHQMRIAVEFNPMIREFCAQRDAILVDAAKTFSAAAPDGIPANDLFAYLNFPSPRGHEILAAQILEDILESRVLEEFGISMESAVEPVAVEPRGLPDLKDCRGLIEFPEGVAPIIEIMGHFNVGLIEEAVKRWELFKTREAPAVDTLKDKVIAMLKYLDEHRRGESPCCTLPAASENAGSPEGAVSGRWLMRIKSTQYILRIIEDGSDLWAFGIDVLRGVRLGDRVVLATDGVVGNDGWRHSIIDGIMQNGIMKGRVQSVNEKPVDFTAYRIEDDR